MTHTETIFINELIGSSTSVTVFLVNGVKLVGFITAQCERSIVLRRESHSQLVYKHAISTVMPYAEIKIVPHD